MADLPELTTGASLDAKDVSLSSPILALAGTPAQAVAPAAASAGVLDRARALLGSTSNNISSTASAVNARVSTATGGNAGLMWIILAVMVAAGLLLFGGKSTGKSKGVFSKFTKGRKPSGGSFAR